MEDRLSEQRKACSAVANALNQLQLVDLAFDDAIAGGPRQTGSNRRFISFHCGHKALEVANLAGPHPAEPVVKLFSRARPQHLSKLLDQFIRLIYFGVQRAKQIRRMNSLSNSLTCS
jgi:hypothetical protein